MDACDTNERVTSRPVSLVWLCAVSWIACTTAGPAVPSPSTVVGQRIGTGWDEIRVGFATDGAGFSDVDVLQRLPPGR